MFEAPVWELEITSGRRHSTSKAMALPRIPLKYFRFRPAIAELPGLYWLDPVVNDQADVRSESGDVISCAG